MATLFSATILLVYDRLSSTQLHTIHGQIPQCSAGRSLYFYVVILEEEEDGFKGVSVDFSNV